MMIAPLKPCIVYKRESEIAAVQGLSSPRTRGGRCAGVVGVTPAGLLPGRAGSRGASSLSWGGPPGTVGDCAEGDDLEPRVRRRSETGVGPSGRSAPGGAEAAGEGRGSRPDGPEARLCHRPRGRLEYQGLEALDSDGRRRRRPGRRRALARASCTPSPTISASRGH